MPKALGKSLNQLSGEATRYAKFYFDPTQVTEWLEQEGCRADCDYAVLVMNRFVPIDCVQGSAAMLRKFVRGSGSALDAAEMVMLKEYWRELESGLKELAAALESGESHAAIKVAARNRKTWPAVAVADSEAEMRSLLLVQYEAIRQSDIAWRCVDSSTHVRRKPSGAYVSIDWFWHGH